MTPSTRRARPRDAPDRTPFEPARLGPVTLRNRFIKAATFEGASPRGQVTDALVDFHRRVGAGGAAMTHGRLPGGVTRRTHRPALHLRRTTTVLPGLRRLTDAVHDTGAAVAAQLGHAGPVANPRSNRAPRIGPVAPREPARHREPRHHRGRHRPRHRRLRARRRAAWSDAGFDSIEVHLGHNYLLSAFLSPKLNRRRDQWGAASRTAPASPARSWPEPCATPWGRGRR